MKTGKKNTGQVIQMLEKIPTSFVLFEFANGIVRFKDRSRRSSSFQYFGSAAGKTITAPYFMSILQMETPQPEFNKIIEWLKPLLERIASMTDWQISMHDGYGAPTVREIQAL